METLVVQNIKKTFKLSKKQQKIEKTKIKLKVAVNDISFTANRGEIFGLLGPNGAGKTTALRCISTLIKQDEGTISVNGYDNLLEEDKVRASIAFLTSDLKLEDHFTPNYLFHFFGSLHGLEEEVIEKRKDELFTKFGIEKFAEVKASELSTGMKQKTSIVISLIHDPEVIIFDEPTNGLDVLTAKAVTDYLMELKEMGKTIIISTHILSVVEKLCDRVGIIIGGELKVCDALSTILEQYQTSDLEDVFFDLIHQESLEKGELI